MELDVYEKIKATIKRLYDIDLTYYKDEQMRRRLDSWLIRVGAPGWDAYFARLNGDEAELTKFRNYLTINVTEFFRDPERWRYLREQIFPDLIRDQRARATPPLRVWSAGCSIGVEAYTLAMIMDELGVRNSYLLATDLDRGALAKAKSRGPYLAEEMRNVTPEQKNSYFQAGGPPFYISEKLAKGITFREQNMLSDRFEENFDLIVCRNVVIYFTTDAKTHLYAKFHAALRPGGILFLGGTEIIPRPQDFGFRNRGVSFYIKQ